ncbi:MAG: carboxymuconolactone decarboxylase family protein [Deltaproteobacteria bacterium]|nr:carboxymuconolactone decarboxylase family protein [Deltaproteobacteria bacterium]MBN2672515.1 carboxymuconolactone decarboxylase family protein [Deltaproteobacteria bacterium]
MTHKHPLSVLSKLDESLFSSIMDQYSTTYEPGALSTKDKILIALAIDTAKGASGGVRSLVKMARDAGATDAEIADVFRVVYQICGVGSMYTAALGLAD